MSELLAITRPDDWNLPLFIHILGALVLIGALAMAASFLFGARRDGSLQLTRLGFRSLLMVALPALIVTRLAAQWLADNEGLEDSDATWLTFGFVSTDGGLLVLLGAMLASGLAVRRASRAEAGGASGTGIALAAWLVGLLIVVYAVVIWLMATKPE